MDHFRTIINKGKKFGIQQLKSCIEEFEGKVSKFHEDNKEQEIAARNAAANQQKADVIKNIIVEATIEKENEKNEGDGGNGINWGPNSWAGSTSDGVIIAAVHTRSFLPPAKKAQAASPASKTAAQLAKPSAKLPSEPLPPAQAGISSPE